MAGMGARDIRRQIKSINSTRQITKAMELVSTAKLKRNRRRFDSTRPYFTKIVSTIRDVVEGETRLVHPMITQRKVNNSLYIILTADRGLCGGYNINVIKEAVRGMQDSSSPQIISVGKRAREYFGARGYNIIDSFEMISEKPTYEDAKSISDLALSLYLDGSVDEVYVVSTKMLSTISQVARTTKIFPIDVEEMDLPQKKTIKSGETEIEDDGDVITYDPSPEGVLDMLMPQLLHSSVLGALIESSAAEQAARRNAMESASENAQEMIENLSLSYNRARQAAITQEITEIVGGASALE